MPIGPGDDILDAIEAGTADDSIISKYKIDAGQLKAFKSLHYGLLHKKMAYEQIHDYYPELKSYFKIGPYIDRSNRVVDSAPAIVGDKPDFTKPVREKAITESTAAPASLKDFKTAAESSKPRQTLQQKFDENVKLGLATINKEIAENDDVIEKEIRQGRYLQAKEKDLTEYAGAPRTDMPAAAMLALDRNRVLPPETKPQDLPVSPDEVLQKKSEIQDNEQQSRDFINKIGLHKPEKAKELQKSIYQLDAYERMKQTPEIGLKVNEMLNEIDKGNVTYNAATQQLVKELGFVDALISGVKERGRQLNNYEIFQQSDEAVKEYLEKQLADFDPDKPVEVPKGAAEIGQMLGTEWSTLLKGAAVNTVGALMAGATGGLSESVAPYVAAAVSAPEYYERSFATGFEDTYSQARRQGMSPDAALKIAKEQAKTEGIYGAAEGFVSSAIGGRIGLRALPKYKITGGFKSAAGNFLKQTGHYAGDTAIDGLVDGLVAGYLQHRKDEAAAEKGIHRDSEQNIRDNIMGELTFSLGVGALTKAGKAIVDPATYKKLAYWITRQNPKTIEEKLGEFVLEGQITQEEADSIAKLIKENKSIDITVPEDIKDVSRMAMIAKIKERQELEAQLEQVDVALHPEIKEKIKKLNEEILEHSLHKKSTNESESETEAETQAEAEGISVEPETQQPLQPAQEPEAQQVAIPQQTSPVEEGAAELNQQGTGMGAAAPTGESMTKEAVDLLEAVSDPTAKPSLKTDNLKRIAQENGVDVSANDTALSIIKKLKAKQQAMESVKNNSIQAPINASQSMGGTTNQPFTKQPPKNQQQAAFYQNSIGGTPTNTGRIPIDPIVGSTPKEIRKIIGDVSKGLKQRLIYAKPGMLGAIGAYLPGFKGIKIRYNNDLDTTAHELGHAIDDHFNIYSALANNPVALQELDQFSSYGSNPPAGHPNPRKYIDQEGFAEWLRAYIVNPVEAENMAPLITSIYKGVTSRKFQDTIKAFSDDVRIFAGANGGDMVMANVEFEPEKPKGLLGQLFKKELTNNEFSISWVNKLAAKFTNPLQAFEKAFKYAQGIRGIDEVLPENDPIILSRILLGIDGKFGEILESGMITGRGDVIVDENGKPKNLEWLLEPFDNTTSASITQDMKDTIKFMIAERTDELSKKFQRGDFLTGIGGGIYSDAAAALKALNYFYNGDPKRLARIQEAARRYRSFADDILSYAVDKGRLSQEQYEAIIDNNVQYVALNRILEVEPDEELTVFQGSGGGLGNTGDFLHEIKGSTKTIENPYASLLDVLYKTMRESDRNETMRAFRDMLVDPRYMNEGEPKRLSDIGMIAHEKDKQAISIFINGKKERWRFQKDVHDQLLALDKEAFRVHAVFRTPAETLRFFTTHFPTFAVRNWLRDTQDRLIKSTTGSGFKDLFGSKEDWVALARAGGLNSGLYFKDKHHYYGLLTEAMGEMSKNKKFILADPTLFKKAWGKYTNLLQKGETSNRVAEYRSAMRDAKKKGMDDYNAALYAAYKSRNLIDFAIMGHWMKVMNQIVPFSNAAVQGLRSAAYSYKHNPGAFLGKIFIYTLVPGAAAWFWNHRNEEDEKLYEELASHERDMFWNFRIAPNKWLSIPKPYELALPQAGMDRLFSYIIAGNKKSFDGFDKSVIKLLLPFDEGNLAGPYQAMFEGKSNYDFFRERNIIPVDEDPLNLAMRHTETASRLGQLLQKATEIEALKYMPLLKGIANIDARKWDHFIKRQFSYTGNFVLKLSDLGKEGSRHKFDLTDTGLFRRSPAYNSVSVQNMIAYAKEFGLTRTPPFKAFNEIVGRYFNAIEPEEQENIGKELVDYSKGLLEDWKANKMDILKIEGFEEKKKAKEAQRQEQKSKK